MRTPILLKALASILVLVFWAAAPILAQGGGKGAANAPGVAKAAEKLSKKEATNLGAFVLQKIDQGLSGKSLANAIQKKLEELKKERKDAKKGAGASGDEEEASEEPAEGESDDEEASDDESDEESEDEDDADEEEGGPGTALQHGLKDKDIPGLGVFVNERLAEGLRGKDLAAAIHEELERRKEERRKEKEAKKGDGEDSGEDAGAGAASPADAAAGDPPGKKDSGKGGGKGSGKGGGKGSGGPGSHGGGGGGGHGGGKPK